MPEDSIQYPYVTSFTKLNNNLYPPSRKATAHLINNLHYSLVVTNLIVRITERITKVASAGVSLLLNCQIRIDCSIHTKFYLLPTNLLHGCISSIHCFYR